MFIFFFLFCVVSVSGQNNPWKKQDLTQTELKKLPYIKPQLMQTHELDFNALKTQLQSAAMRTGNLLSSVIISLPNNKGSLEEFEVYETSILAAEIAKKHPNIKTYIGYGKKGARARISVTPLGLNTMISYLDKPTVFTVPVKKGNVNQYVTYDRNQSNKNLKDFECLTPLQSNRSSTNQSITGRDANDQILRTFRLAVSTTSEYTRFYDDGNDSNGDAKADALAQVVSTVNRMNEVFEVDMAITFQLVSGTNVIYNNYLTDPYTGSLNSEVQNTLTSVIGEANYDIGHLFSYSDPNDPLSDFTDGNNGNAGCIGCVCVDNQKGSAFSQHTFKDNDGGPYMSDYFDIDYVPHEVGHQMGANHTFSYNSEGTGVNAEPGSGTTIMGYAGITGSNDVQDHSDPYFHYYSIQQILNNITSSPNNCWTSTAIINNPPIADAGNDVTIPVGTAFKLKGSATDADGGDVLTYTWEQIDDGTSTFNNFGPTLVSGALFRSRPPSLNSFRYMPMLSRIISGNLTETLPQESIDNTTWETVSNVTRTMNFALTVRDRSETNGTGQFPQSSYDEMVVNVDAGAGPFIVTSQQAKGTVWVKGSSQTVTWDVAGTDKGNINVSKVNILLSIDGGVTFSTILASNVDNDGSHEVLVPDVGSGNVSNVRIMVEAVDNIFLAVNSGGITIEEPNFAISASNRQSSACSPDDVVFNLVYNSYGSFSGVTNFSATGLPAGVSAVFSPASASVDDTAVTLTLSGTNGLNIGNYAFQISATSGGITETNNLNFNVFESSITSPILSAPVNGATEVDAAETLTWNSDTNVESYLIEISTSSNFSSIKEQATVTTSSYVPSSLENNTTYFWRVTPQNTCGVGSASSVNNFTTKEITCNTFSAIDLPTEISILEGISYTSTITVGANFSITDINVTVDIEHTWLSDLEITLTSPTGTIVTLTNENGGSGDNYNNTIFDQESVTSITNGTAPFTGTFKPEGDLSAIYGEMSAGDWILTVTDKVAEDGGQINSFEIDLCVNGNILSASDYVNELSNFNVYPNPSSGVFKIGFESENNENVSLKVYDLAGRLVKNQSFQKQFGRFTKTVDFSDLSRGFYILKVENSQKISSRKLIIE